MGKNQPSPRAVLVGHIIVGVAATWVTAKVVKAIGPSIAIGVVAVVMHAELDVPVAKQLSELGF